MTPGNWDAPFIISPHDPNTLYAGLDQLFVSHDRGASWTGLGDLTTGVDRRRLAIMGEMPDSFTLSLDDGIPYYPTLTAIAESPMRAGVLFVGTDDGNIQVSTDDGRTFSEVSGRVPGLPDDAWINGLEASRVEEGRIYMTATNYRNDDYANYLYVSEDYGRTWQSIAGDLPPERVTRTVREDPRNPDVLWLGTEFGAFVSLDRGGHWTELTGDMPTLAVNDLRVHPRDNDLVLATHGRGHLDPGQRQRAPGGHAAGAGGARAPVLHGARPGDPLRLAAGPHRGHDLPRGESPVRRHHRLLAGKRGRHGARHGPGPGR